MWCFLDLIVVIDIMFCVCAVWDLYSDIVVIDIMSCICVIMWICDWILWFLYFYITGLCGVSNSLSPL